MAELKYTPVPHDHKAFLAKARTRKGFTEAFDALALEYQVAWAARGGTGSRRHGVRSCHLPPSPVLSFSARKLKCPTLTCHRPPASTCASLREDDLPLLYEVQSNRDAMRFTCVASSLQEFSRRLRTFEDSRAGLGFAPWVVMDRSESRVIGWGGLNVDPFDPGWGNEVSYWFHPAYWGRGLATELVLSSLSHAFDTLSLSRVSAFAMPDNIASIRVLEKCGFAFLRYEPSLGRNHYEILSPSESAALPSSKD